MGLLQLQSLMSSLWSLPGSPGLWDAQGSVAGMCLQLLTALVDFSILVTSTVRAVVSLGSRALSFSLAAGTTESGVVQSDCR